MVGFRSTKQASKMRKTHKTAKKIHKEVINEIRKAGETKIYTTVATAANVTFSGTISNSLTIPVKGDAYNQRTGIQISPLSLNLKGQIIVGGTTNIVRLVLFRWKDNTATAVPVVADLITAGYTVASYAPLFTYIWGPKRKKFSVLWDRTFAVDQGKQVVYFNKTIKLKGTQVFNPGAVTDGTSQLFLMSISDDGAVSYPSLEYSHKFLYKDL